MQNRKGIIAYLLIAFGMAWLWWEIVIRLGIPVRSPRFQIASLPAAFAPAIACFIVRKWITREGFADAGLRLNLQRWRYYLVAWLLPVVVVVCIVILGPLLGFKPDFSLVRGVQSLKGSAAPVPHALSSLWLTLSVLLITALFAAPFSFGEEFGWRSYLQLRLSPDRPVLGAILTGVIWGAWHLPANLRGYDFPDHPLLGGVVVFTGSCVFLSIIFGWLRLKSGSIWCSSLAHAASNAVGASLTLLLFGGGPGSLFVFYVGVLAWIPLGALCTWIVLTGQLKPADEAAGTTEVAYAD